MKLSPEAVLKSAMENGMLDVAQVQAQHNLKIWQGTDGKWRSFQDRMVGDNTVAKYDSDYQRYFENTKFAKQDIKTINYRKN